MQYSDSFKSQIVRRLSGPKAMTATALAQEVGIAQPTLSRWLTEATLRSMTVDEPKSPKSSKDWTPVEKFRALAQAEGLDGEALGAFLRREGLHEAQLTEWRQAAQAALGAPSGGKQSRADVKRVKELERELNRKEKALAEVSALLVLKKNMSAYWAGVDDSTDDETDK